MPLVFASLRTSVPLEKVFAFVVVALKSAKPLLMSPAEPAIRMSAIPMVRSLPM